jgi:hypothetical protein
MIVCRVSKLKSHYNPTHRGRTRHRSTCRRRSAFTQTQTQPSFSPFDENCDDEVVRERTYCYIDLLGTDSFGPPNFARQDCA